MDKPKQHQQAKKDFAKLGIDEKVRLVDEALTPEVYPALQMDGGGLEIMDIEDYTVMVRYFGACGGCHIGKTGTLDFITWTLQTKVDEKITVEIV